MRLGARVKKMKLQKATNYLFIEKSDGNNIEKGSRIYCGVCGGIVGVMKVEMKFCFNSCVFMKNLDKGEYSTGTFGGIKHNCGHYVRVQDFMTVEKYYELIKK